MSNVGLDIGTSFLIAAEQGKDDKVKYREFRDAFYRIKPATAFAGKMIEKGLANKSFLKDIDGSYVVVGQDAIQMAVERNESVRRPLYRGVISPREPDARRILKFILSKLVGTAPKTGGKIVYSVPAEPVDLSDEEFNTGYHEDVFKRDLSELGWDASPVNEAEAIGYSELGDDDYTGILLSAGAGMQNLCVMSAGEPVIKLSVVRSGDFIDRMAAQSTGQTDSVVQVEKENSDFVIGEENSNPILSAVSAYYIRVIDYVVKHVSHAVRNSKHLPKFSSPIPVVISGGTSMAKGFPEVFGERLKKEDLPFEIKEVRPAKDQLRAVARGCMIASSLL